jgi:hypothetical protein
MTDKSKNDSELPDIWLPLIFFALVAIGGLIFIAIHDAEKARQWREYNENLDRRVRESKEEAERIKRGGHYNDNARWLR